MKIETLQTENKHSFQVENEGEKYKATIWLDSDSNKFIDWEILDANSERVNQDIEDEIIGYIDANWEKL